MITIPDALQALRPGAEWVLRGDTYEGLEWLDTTQTQPTEAEVNAEIARLTAEQPLKDCKAKAKQLIAATDWSILPDVNITNKADFEAYRATLRGYIIDPVAEPQWPEEPQPIWSK